MFDNHKGHQERKRMTRAEIRENEEAKTILARLEEEFHGRPMIADALRRGRLAIMSLLDKEKDEVDDHDGRTTCGLLEEE